MKETKRATGARYEEIAVCYLQEQGYMIVERNYRCPVGEIDIIGRNEGYLCFIEVKYRKSEKRGDPMEAVNWQKQRKICKISSYYMMQRKISDVEPCRFDVVGITPEVIKLVKDAFSYVY